MVRRKPFRKMSKHKKLLPVMVEWRDILDGGAEWSDDHNIVPADVVTVGFLLSRNKSHLVIVRDYCDVDDERSLGGRLAVPVGCVKKIRRLS